MGFMKNLFAGQRLDAIIVGKGSPGATRIQRIRKVTAAVDLASLGTGAVGAVTVTITGARVGDVVIAQPPAALGTGFGVIGCLVTANDTVSVRVLNGSGGTIDEPSRNYDFLHIRLG